MVAPLAGRCEAAPHYLSVRWWLLRLGLHELTRAKEQAEDWIWIIDHTMQLGEVKCLIVLGVRQSAWAAAEDRRLAHEDVELIALQPVRTSTGEVVCQQLNEAAKTTGVPRAIVSDDGRDLHLGLKLFRQEHSQAAWIYDIKHKTASLLKHRLEKDEEWKSFVSQVNLSKQKVCMTPLAFLAPPQQRGKARYMNVDSLVAWGKKAIGVLDQPPAADHEEVDAAMVEEKFGWLREYRQPLERWNRLMSVIETAEHHIRREGIQCGTAGELKLRLDAVASDESSRDLRDDLLAFLREQSRQVRPGERLLGSSEIVESVIGKYKRLQGERGHHGLTPMILSIGSIVGRKTVSALKTALEKLAIHDVLAWCGKHIGATVQSLRKKYLPNRASEQKRQPNPSPNTS